MTEGKLSEENPGEEDPAGTEPVNDGAPWSRLNPRMLFVHPMRELIRYLPVLLIALIAGAAGGEPWWVYALSGLGIVVGLLHWFTTSYRITETHVQVRRGLLNRQTLSVPRDRIRSVDVDSTILHRLVGLSVVKVGTGASHGKDELEFNALLTRDVPALRRELLRRASASVRADGADGAVGDELEAEAIATGSSSQNFSRWRPGWVRYAPFTLSGVASIVVVAIFLLQIQFFEGGLLTRLPWVQQSVTQLGHLPFVTLALWGVVILIVLASIVAMARYLLSYTNFRIGRAEGGLHISHGLLRTRQITLDEQRLRGVQISEPLSLRAVTAASAHAVMTGLGGQRGGVALLSPPGPRGEAFRIAEQILGASEPLDCELEQHGPVARRRRYTRAALPVGILAIAAALLEIAGSVGPMVWWVFAFIVPASAFLAWDRYRGLGHALLPGWIVARSGSLSRRRVVLATEGIIGWTIRRSFFQRRAGVATIIVTTAAGRHRYAIPDLPESEVWPLIEAVSLKRESPVVIDALGAVAEFAKSL